MSKSEIASMAAMVGMLIWVKVVTGEAALVIILKHLPAIG